MFWPPMAWQDLWDMAESHHRLEQAPTAVIKDQQGIYEIWECAQCHDYLWRCSDGRFGGMLPMTSDCEEEAWGPEDRLAMYAAIVGHPVSLGDLG